LGIIIILAVHASHAAEYKVPLALLVHPAPTGLSDRPGHRDRPDRKGNQAQRAYRVYRGFKE